MENALGFTTSEFVRLQSQVTNLLKMKKELEAELAIWKPNISINADSDPANLGITYVAQYGADGFQKSVTAHSLAVMEPEVLADLVHKLAAETAAIRTKKIADMIRPVMQRAADYSKTVTKGK